MKSPHGRPDKDGRARCSHIGGLERHLCRHHAFFYMILHQRLMASLLLRSVHMRDLHPTAFRQACGYERPYVVSGTRGIAEADRSYHRGLRLQ